MSTDDIARLAEAISKKMALCSKNVLTVDEVVQYTGLTKSYLYKLTHARLIPHSKPGGKLLYFRREDLETWMMNNPIATDDELTERALEYCRRNEMNFTK